MKWFKWPFGLLALTLAWNSDLTSWLQELASLLGAAPDSVLSRLIIDLGTPAALTAITGLSLWFYSTAVWPLIPGSPFLGGWWIYTLRGRAQAQHTVVGYFFMTHTPEHAQVSEGRAFYVEDNGIYDRGDWSSFGVVVDSAHLNVLFTLKSTLDTTEALPTTFDGVFAIKRTSQIAVVGRSAWAGRFQDLFDRRDVFGPFYAERLGLGRWNATKIQERLLSDHLTLVQRLPKLDPGDR